MAILKIGLTRVNAEGLVAKANHVFDQLTAHAATFPSPNPTLPAFKTAIDELGAAIADAIDGGRSAHQTKRTKFRTLKNMVLQLADFVGNRANGDADLIILGGFELRDTRRPSHIPSAPVELEARTPDVTNAVKVEWKGEKKVRMYQVQMSTTDPSSPTAAWTAMALTSKRQCTITDLEPYRMYWFRVVAVNVVGESLPSDIIMARAA